MSGFDKQVIEEGDGVTYPKVGDTVTMEYTGEPHYPQIYLPTDYY